MKNFTSFQFVLLIILISYTTISNAADQFATASLNNTDPSLSMNNTDPTLSMNNTDPSVSMNSTGPSDLTVSNYTAAASGDNTTASTNNTGTGSVGTYANLNSTIPPSGGGNAMDNFNATTDDGYNYTSAADDIPGPNITDPNITSSLSMVNYSLEGDSNYTAQTNSSGNTLMSIINQYSDETADGLSYFRDALIATDLLDQVLGNDDPGSNYTVFAPTNAAIKGNAYFMLYMKGLDENPKPRWVGNLKDALLYHLVGNQTLMSTDIFDSQKSLIDTMLFNNTTPVSQFSRKIGGAGLVDGKYDVKKSNGILHVIDHVMVPDFMKQPFGDLTLQPEFGPDKLDRVSLVDVVEVVDKSKATLNQISESGLTFAGCRIRAFNRLEEYLPQTINLSRNVTWGELLNASFAKESRVNFIEYSLIPKNYYYDDIPNNYVELVMPLSGSTCAAHMWITKFDGKFCFNNGCLIQSDLPDRPGLRKYIASNGVGYVIDKCQVCPGVAMLINYATEYTYKYNLRQTSQFFVASLWNLRNLSLSVGHGNQITLFAPYEKAWDVFNLEDITRLASDFWNPHKLDLLRHMMIQGRYSYGELSQKYHQSGPYNLTSLAGQPLLVDYNKTSKLLTLAGGDITFKDLQGVDGLAHFTQAVPLPKSMTYTVYDFAKEDANFSTQVTLIDSVFLAADMKRLSPLTVLFVPNPKWENIAIKMEEISTAVLENMIFKSLLWCDTLREMKGQYAESHNQKYWSITINEDNMPCFEFSISRSSNETSPKSKSKTNSSVARSCITKCDVLARNGIVHEVDTLLLFETPQTLPPQQDGARLPGMAGDHFDDILKNSANKPATSTDSSSSASAGGTTGTSTSTGTGTASDGGYQRPVPSSSDINPDSSAHTIASTFGLMTFVSGIVAILLMM